MLWRGLCAPSAGSFLLSRLPIVVRRVVHARWRKLSRAWTLSANAQYVWQCSGWHYGHSVIQHSATCHALNYAAPLNTLPSANVINYSFTQSRHWTGLRLDPHADNIWLAAANRMFRFGGGGAAWRQFDRKSKCKKYSVLSSYYVHKRTVSQSQCSSSFKRILRFCSLFIYLLFIMKYVLKVQYKKYRVKIYSSIHHKNTKENKNKW